MAETMIKAEMPSSTDPVGRNSMPPIRAMTASFPLFLSLCAFPLPEHAADAIGLPSTDRISSIAPLTPNGHKIESLRRDPVPDRDADRVIVELFLQTRGGED